MATIIRPHERDPQPLPPEKIPAGADPKVANASKRRVLSEAGPYVQVTHIAAGTSVHPHSHAAPEAMIILEGAAIIDDERLEAGTMLIIPANEEYGFDVPDDTDCEFVVVRPESGGFAGPRGQG